MDRNKLIRGLAAVLTTVAEEPSPAGIVAIALLQAGYSSAEFEAIRQTVKATGWVTEANYVLTATATGKAKAAELEAVLAKGKRAGVSSPETSA